MITLSDKAFQRVKTILGAPENAGKALRVLVYGGGCAGLEYGMALGFEKDDDYVLGRAGYKVVIDSKSLSVLDGSEIDYYESIQSSGFKVECKRRSHLRLRHIL